MRSVEVTGKTVDEAITSALLQLGASSDQVDIEILEEGGKGFLGLLKKNVKIKATLKEGEEQVVETTESKLADLRAAKAEKEAKAAGLYKEEVQEPVQAAAEKAEEAVKEAAEDAAGFADEAVDTVEDVLPEKADEAKPMFEEVKEETEAALNNAANGMAQADVAEEAPAVPAEPISVTAVTATGETVTMDDTIEQRLRKANAEREKNGGERSERRDEDRSERYGRGDRGDRRDSRRDYKDRSSRNNDYQPKPVVEPKVYEIPEDKDEVIAKAKEFLENVLKNMGIETTVNGAFSEDGILELNIEGEGMGVIIGKRGATLDSLQYLTTLVVNKGRADHVHIKLDTEGYRARRQETLEKLAISLAKKAKRTNRRVMLEPMNPYERRIIHSVLQSDRGVETYSEGEEPYRKVVIAPRRRR